MIARMPGVAAVVILSLGVGIGVNTAIFSWTETLVLKPLPAVADGASFHAVEARTEAGTYPGSSWLEYRDLRERLTTLRDVIAFRMVPFYVGDADRTERSYGLLVSGNYFKALGLRPAAGRLPETSDETSDAAAAPAIVISYEFWQTHFNSAPDVFGRAFRVNGQPLTIAGVAPRNFQGTILGLNFDLWASARLAPLLLKGSRELDDRGFRGYSVIGRLRLGASDAQAQTNLDATMRELERAYPDTNTKLQGELLPFWKSPRGPQQFLVGALTVLQSLMLLLLLAVCGNTANLMLARAGTRQREISIRLAMGAGRWRIARLLLVENLVLAALGALLGAVVAAWATQALRAVPFPTAFPIRFQTGIDAVGLAFNMLLGAAVRRRIWRRPGVSAGASQSAAHPARRAGDDDAERLARRIDGRRSRARDRGAGRGGSVPEVVPRHASERDGLQPRRRDARGLRSIGEKRRQRRRARFRRAPARRGAGAARRHGGRDLLECPARSPWATDPIVHDRGTGTNGQGARSGAVEHGHARLLRHARHCDRAGKGLRRSSRPPTTPQVIVNEEFQRRYLESGDPIGRRLDTGGRRDVHGQRHRPHDRLRIVWRSAHAGHVLLLSRPAGALRARSIS